MNGLPYYKAYPRDFIEGTVGMPFEIKCAYRVVLDLIYMQGGDLPDDPRYISGLLGCSLRKWKTIREALVSAGKIQVNGEFLTNYRAVSELETLAKLQDKQRENRSRPNKNKDLATPRSNHTEPEPDIREEAKASSAKKRGSRLRDDWVLPREWGQWALSEQWPEPVIREQAEKFRDYWISVPGQKGVKLDWLATWRNWMRNSNAPKVHQGDRHGQRTSKGSRKLDAALAAVERHARP